MAIMPDPKCKYSMRLGIEVPFERPKVVRIK